MHIHKPGTRPAQGFGIRGDQQVCVRRARPAVIPVQATDGAWTCVFVQSWFLDEQSLIFVLPQPLAETLNLHNRLLDTYSYRGTGLATG